jgi:uncharacterized protein (DUF2062 family)
MSSRVRRALQVLLHVEDTPHRIALAFGIGVWIAFTPLLGIHTLLALAIAFSFRLSRVAILLGAYINNPWTLAPLYLTGTMVGCVLMGVSTEGLAALDWSLEGSQFYAHLLASLRPYLWPFLLGNSVLGVAGGVLGYFLLRRVLERRALRVAGEHRG